MDDKKQNNAGAAGGRPQKITVSTYSFEDLRKRNFLYVDKTALIHKIFLQDKDQFFLARPRRFGKSLLVSTLEAIFEGKRELFKGLALDSIDYDWPKHPVIHLDMGLRPADTPEQFNESLNLMLAEIILKYRLDVPRDVTPPNKFANIILRLAEQSPTGKIVLLVDEYDKPLVDHLGRDDVSTFREMLKSFYSVIKGTEKLQWTALITGVSKFAKVSIFSDLNNLTDLTMNHDAATLLGYTRAELRENFGPHVAAFAEKRGMTLEEAHAELEEWYDGYRFEEEAETVFNPVSIGNCLTNRKLENYWFVTGTPTFLLNLLRGNPVDLGDMTASELALSAYEPENPPVLPLLLQTGYLTIKRLEMRGRRRVYVLDFPNREVSESFTEAIVTGLCNVPQECENYIDKVTSALRDGDVGKLIQTLRDFFRGIPYDLIIQKERFYQMIFYAIIQLAGGDVQAEVHTNTGRIDAVLKTADKIFLFEFKLNGTVEEAMEQIRERRYYEKYLGDGRELVLVGVAFDKETRNIGKWDVAAPPATKPRG